MEGGRKGTPSVWNKHMQKVGWLLRRRLHSGQSGLGDQGETLNGLIPFAQAFLSAWTTLHKYCMYVLTDRSPDGLNP